MKSILSLTVDHLGELPYECETCDLKFKKTEHLRKHQTLVHLGQKYTCVICGKEYGDEGSLGKHLRKVHNGLNKRKLKAIEKEMKNEEKRKRLGNDS